MRPDLANKRWSLQSRQPGVGYEEVYVSQREGELKGRESIVGLKHAVVCAPERANHHSEQFGLLVSNDDVGPLVEA